MGHLGQTCNPTPRIPLFVRPSVTEKDRIVLANEYTMRTSSPMYDAVKMMMFIIFYVPVSYTHLTLPTIYSV